MKTIIEMAREAGFNKNELAYLGDNFTRFAELVRADEREACAKVCDDLYKKWVDDLVNDTDDTADSGTPDCVDCATAIRARHTCTPPQRPWVGLTGDELADLWYKESTDWMEFARAHEAKLKEKNT